MPLQSQKIERSDVRPRAPDSVRPFRRLCCLETGSLARSARWSKFFSLKKVCSQGHLTFSKGWSRRKLDRAIGSRQSPAHRNKRKPTGALTSARQNASSLRSVGGGYHGSVLISLPPQPAGMCRQPLLVALPVRRARRRDRSTNAKKRSSARAAGESLAEIT
jgi:hypothetical protein